MICTAAGAAFSSALKRRCTMLRSVLGALDEMSAKIRYAGIPLNELIAEMTGERAYSDCTFLKRTAAGMNSGLTASEAWTAAADTTPFFSDNDRRILADIGSRLGGTDTEGQLSMLALGSTLISRELEAAELECSRKSRTLMSVWTMCGIGAGIIII